MDEIFVEFSKEKNEIIIPFTNVVIFSQILLKFLAGIFGHLVRIVFQAYSQSKFLQARMIHVELYFTMF